MAEQSRPRPIVDLELPCRSLPRIISIADELRQRSIRLDIHGGLECFEGHFPGHPVLPGIVQVHWAVVLSGVCFEGLDAPPTEIKRLKFKSIVVPPDILDLSLRLVDDREILFSYTSTGRQCSEGRLVFFAGMS